MSHDRLISATARRTLAVEAEALRNLGDALDEAAFARVVHAVHACPGRLIATGIGKSALVAQKLAATFNSTGQPAAFMHAADAIHGDLGMIAPGDLVLCLSKSGETAELRALVPSLRRLGHPVVALTANPAGYLAAAADFVLLTPLREEADPNRLAPTTSAILQMAMGDALASALLAVRGFTAEDFAKLHPGGTLGKQLYSTLDDLARHNTRPAVGPEATLEDVVVEMTGKRLGATAVVGAEDALLGLITDGDLRRALGRGVEVVRLTAAQLMTPAPRTLPPTELAVRGLAFLEEASVNHIPLTDARGRYVGMVHLHDFVREGIV